ncbi:MAG: DNA-directed RNA polymerase subunit D [Candidatus Freyarchaeota archaeon]|nr:DNA-directed RNA polymerase subunit D [Candidatus Freyrarchaeum guaymaensis]
MLNVKILSMEGNMLRFVLEGVDVSVANALRRTMLAEVPTMAIDEVIIIENTSPIFDEVLAHRLGLIPLVTDLESYVLPEECSCGGEGCVKCRLTLTLEKEAEEEGVVIYSGDLQSQDPVVRPVSDKIPLAKMGRNQKVVLEAYARLGRGKEHAKWQPVSCCAYKYMPILNIDQDKCVQCGDCVSICPKNILAIEDNQLVVKDLLNCSLCKSCEEECRFDAIQVSWDDTKFIFTVESTGSLPPDEIVKVAVDILLKKLEDLESQLVTASEEA